MRSAQAPCSGPGAGIACKNSIWVPAAVVERCGACVTYRRKRGMTLTHTTTNERKN